MCDCVICYSNMHSQIDLVNFPCDMSVYIDSVFVAVTFLHTDCYLFPSDVSTYSRIPLIQHSWFWTGAILSNIPDYETVPILTYDLTDNFCYCP